MMKKIRILLTTAVLSFICSNAVAIGMKDTAYVKQAIDQTIALLEKAVTTFDKNNDDKAVIELLMEAKQVQKTISSSDGKLSMIKSKATHKLSQARSNFNDGDIKEGGEAVKEALADFKELKEKYNAVR